jgi:2-dehydro-3-deoxy-D-arabinonate dehydratase
MKLVKAIDDQRQKFVAVWEDPWLFPLMANGRWLTDLSEVLDQVDPLAFCHAHRTANAIAVGNVSLLAPIDQQEVWAAGVTYKRSQSARMEESETAADCYDRVYRSPRPELFFKASPHRVAGPGEPLRIRYDSLWNVPEPELALVLNSRLELVGFTIGNDMSSRDIEGENPLYLPQAKVYTASCALGPQWVLGAVEAWPQTTIRIAIERAGQTVVQDQVETSRIHRQVGELVDYLGRSLTFPDGVLLMTGTGIVPSADFSLQAGDLVRITIDGIGTLTNSVKVV